MPLFSHTMSSGYCWFGDFAQRLASSKKQVSCSIPPVLLHGEKVHDAGICVRNCGRTGRAAFSSTCTDPIRHRLLPRSYYCLCRFQSLDSVISFRFSSRNEIFQLLDSMTGKKIIVWRACFLDILPCGRPCLDVHTLLIAELFRRTFSGKRFHGENMPENGRKSG